jgi:hypothetical protein
MSEMIAVKAVHGGDTRRFAYDPALKFAGLKEEVKARFGLTDDNLKLTFKDDEGELCLVTGDTELAEAVRIASTLKPPILRVHIEVLVEGVKAKNGEDAVQDNLGESARQLLAALEIPEEDALRFLSRTNLVEEAQKYRSFMPMLPMLFGGMCCPEPSAEKTDISDASVIHDGVECDKSGMCPIVGNRWNLPGHDYDLCEAEYQKLPAEEKVKYRKIEKPASGHPLGGMMRGWMRGMTGGGPCHKWSQSAPGPSSNPINASMLPEEVLHPGAQGPAVASLQQALIQLGHLHPGAIRWRRGMYGPRTTQAIAALQQASGEAPTGIYDGAIRAKLVEQLNGASPAPPKAAAHGGHGSWRRGHYSSRFVSDKSLPDGAKVQPGHKFTKTWTLRNDGATAWPETTSLVFVKGDRLHEDDVKLVGKVEPGAEVDVSVEMFAPEPTGRYVSFWRLSAVGEAERGRNRPPLVGGFGQRVWLQVLVDGEACELSSDENEAEAEERLESPSHPAGKPLEQWSVGELKKELKANGADFSDCVEKDDLVSLLRATLDSQHAPKPSNETQEKPEVDAAAAQVEEGIKAACSAFGVPTDDVSALLGNVQPFLEGLQQQGQQQGQPNFDLGALMQNAMPFLQGLQKQQQQGQQQGQPNFDLGALMQNAMPFLNAMGAAPGHPAPAAAAPALATEPAANPAPAPAPTPEPSAEVPVTPAAAEPVATTPTPVAAAEATDPIEELKLPDATKQKLTQLREMGFLDDTENLAALDKAEGRVERAVEILFSAM